MTEGLANRQLRIFVSSTFNDMRQERNVLLEKVFPMVAAYCHRRKIEFVGVDLRWGVSEEQSKRGETVAICMAEIDHCRPLFMGMIGQRYGWIPAGSDVSVTEQEMLYGALDAPEDTEAFFYLRDPALTEALCGPFEPEPRLDDLKDRVRRSGFRVMDGYRTLDEFGRRVYEDLIAAVDRLTLGVEEPSPLEALRNDHLFLARRCAAGFVDRPEEMAELNALAGCGGLTLLTGETGVGKTAMLAKWVLDNVGREDAYTFAYFVGSAADKGWEQLARQLVGELCLRFGFQQPPTDDREALRRAVCQTLSMAARNGRVLLALDQLDALALDDGFGLSWLPEALPEGVAVVASLDEGEALTRLRRRPHRELELRLLSADAVCRVAESYLSVHSKTLSLRQMAALRESEQARNPLYLITLLNEIRHVGRHNLLTEQLADYLACDGVEALFDRVLARLDRDYDEGGDGLSRRLLTLLEASRGGLTEGELLPLLGDVPFARFAPLRLALEGVTAVSGGALHVAVPQFSRAVRRHYGLTDRDFEECRRRMADWFYDRRDTPRRARVLPWLLDELGDYNRLYETLSQPDCFEELWQQNRYEAKAYWTRAAAHGPGAKDGYRALLEAPGQYDCALLESLAEFFCETGEAECARTLLLWLTGPESRADDAQRSSACGLLGNLCQREGQYARAEEWYRRKYELDLRAGDRYEQSRALGNIGLVAMHLGELPAAREAFEAVLELAVSLNQRDAQQVALGNLGNIAFALGDAAGARELYERQKTISMDSGNVAGIINACGALGVLHGRAKDYAAAEREFAEQERQSRRIGAFDGLSNALGNLAALAQIRGDRDRAEALLREKLALCRRTGQFLGEQGALGNLAALAAERGATEEALDLARQRVDLTRRCRAFRPYAEALTQLARLEEALGRAEDARQHRLQALGIARQQGFAIE